MSSAPLDATSSHVTQFSAGDTYDRLVREPASPSRRPGPPQASGSIMFHSIAIRSLGATTRTPIYLRRVPRQGATGLVVAGMLAVFVFASCSAGVGATPSQSGTRSATAGTPSPSATASASATASPSATATPVPTPTRGPAGFTATGSMGHARGWHTATLLTDGRVLIAGGRDDSGVHASAELFDPATGTFSPTGSMTVARHGHTATRLSDGRVLIAGGLSANGTTAVYLASAELYDPATGKFSPTGSMAQVHDGHTDRKSTRLNSSHANISYAVFC